LRREGIACSRQRTARLLRRLGLAGRRRRKRYRPLSRVDGVNLLCQRFAPGGVSGVCADITQLRSSDGWLYLAVVLCLRSRRVLGYASGTSPSGQLSLAALQQAAGRQALRGWLHHSDRGLPYTCSVYQRELAARGLKPSLSGKGNCYDNAAMESFFATLKRELPLDKAAVTSRQLRSLLAHYIDGYYNRVRLHSALGNHTPDEYAKMLVVA
jgi:transposase InsO family protein